MKANVKDLEYLTRFHTDLEPKFYWGELWQDSGSAGKWCNFDVKFNMGSILDAAKVILKLEQIPRKFDRGSLKQPPKRVL